MSAADRQCAEIIVELERQDWVVKKTGNNHYSAAPPDKTKSLVVFSTTDDVHGQMNMVRDLKRRGFIWPIPSKNDAAGEQRKSTSMRTTVGDIPALREALEVAHELNVAEKAALEVAPTTMPESRVAVATTEDAMDKIFRELKEARGLNKLAEDDVIECMRRLDEAQRALTIAQTTQRQTGEALKEKKAAFDRAFEAAAA